MEIKYFISFNWNNIIYIILNLMIKYEVYDSILYKKCDKYKILVKGIYVEVLILYIRIV